MIYPITEYLKKDESELCNFFFIAITAPSLFILCLFFLEGENKRERESNGDKKMHVVPIHPGRKPITRKYIFLILIFANAINDY